MGVLEKMTGHGQSTWKQGKLLWYFTSIIVGSILIMLGLISSVGLIEVSAIKTFLGAAVLFLIAFILKNEKTKDI